MPSAPGITANSGYSEVTGSDRISVIADRATVVTKLWQAENKPVINYLMQFEDVPSETWYTEAVRWCAGVGIVEGYSDTAFGPDDPITIEQFATILWRYAKHKGYDASVSDAVNIPTDGISEYAVPAMQWAYSTGLMEYDGESVSPRENISRSQADAVLMRLYELLK